MNANGGRRRTALVTGAAAGLGASFAEVFARNGYDVILVDRQEERVRARAEEIGRRHGVTTHALVVDLTDPRAARSMIQRCEELGHPVDVLVNNAGHHLNRFFHELPWNVIDRNLRLFLDVVVETTHAVLPGMIARE